jgi:hypothetical protein
VAARVRGALALRLASIHHSVASTWVQSIGIHHVRWSSVTVAQAQLAEQRAATRVVVQQRLSLEELVRLRRGETSDDPRPNKALDPQALQALLVDYPLVDSVVEIARQGVTPSWTATQPPQHRPPKNHKSAKLYLPALVRKIREGQAGGTYLVVDTSLLSRWKTVQCSPLGAVEKNGVDPAVDIRPIHDLSFPEGASTNAHLDPTSIPYVLYRSVTTIARRIEAASRNNPGCTIRILKGDVQRAYRNIMLHADHVQWMGATIPEESALVVDLAAPFGWSGSPANYSAFGRGISWLVGTNSPASVSESTDTEPFFGYEWVDDHILVEPDREDRLELAEATLRLSMLAILGPDAINEPKFSGWSTKLKALGLVWNTEELTVSMPSDKIKKCIDRINALLEAAAVSKQQLQKLLGSLRHISSCLRAAKPFYQHLNSVCGRLRPFGTRTLSEKARRDLTWFLHILEHGHLEKLPLRFFGTLPPPDIHLYMDASDAGLAVLNPAANEYIQLRFDANESELIKASAASGFTINVREHFCMALAALSWGSQWHLDYQLPHIVCWSDNKSAVSWINRLASKNVFGQEINRAIGLAEAVYNVRLSAHHLPGVCNRMADAGSRAWSEPYSSLWTHLSADWRQVPVPERWRKIYSQFSATCSPSHWPSRPKRATNPPGANGVAGAPRLTSAPGCPTTHLSHLDNSRSSLLSATNTAIPRGPVRQPETPPRPSSPRSAISRGIIDGSLASASDFFRTTPWQSEVSSDSSHPHNPCSQSHWPSSDSSTGNSTSNLPTTASCGGLRSWASSFC